MKWYVGALKKYAVFDGRARRREYWMYSLFNLLIYCAVAVVDKVLGLSGILDILYILATFMPGLALSVRRLHDIGKSGFWLLLIGIPIIGAIMLLFYACRDSQAGNNEFGANPKPQVISA